VVSSWTAHRTGQQGDDNAIANRFLFIGLPPMLLFDLCSATRWLQGLFGRDPASQPAASAARRKRKAPSSESGAARSLSDDTTAAARPQADQDSASAFQRDPYDAQLGPQIGRKLEAAAVSTITISS